MSKSLYQQAKFLISAAKLSQLPPDEGAEVAFAGRSNAGKSSALNTLTQQKSLAKTSKTPGRTQLLNLFELNEHCRLMDLPGYGFAKVPGNMRKKWAELIDGYLTQRECLKGIVLVMDIRHPLTPFDQQMLDFCEEMNLPIHMLLTKADKLKFGAQKSTLLSVQRSIKHYPLASAQIFSSLKNIGVDELVAKLDEWFASCHPPA